MSKRLEILATTMAAWAVVASLAFGQGGMGGGHGGGGKPEPGGVHRPSAPADHYRGDTTPAPQTVLTPHCGQYLVTQANCFELVFTMSQVRLYVYDKARNALSARQVQAKLALQPPGENDVIQIPFQYVAPPPGADQDYVAAAFNFARLRDREVPLTIEFVNLPDPRQTTACFTPLFTVEKVRPYVAQVVLTENDREGIGRQRICPVSGDVLGNKGQVVKLLIGERPIYLCCKECTADVRRTPEKYLPPPLPPPAQAPGKRP